MRVLELVRWNSLGYGDAEKRAEELSYKNLFHLIGTDEISLLLRQKGYPLQGVRNAEYYVFYEYHPSSGYRTDIYVGENGNIIYKTIKPIGGVLCAFYSEVIIFTLTNKF